MLKGSPGNWFSSGLVDISLTHPRPLSNQQYIWSPVDNFVGEWGQPGGMYEQRLGLKRFKLCNPYRRLLDEEITVAFGSDCGYCPPWPFNPIYGIWSLLINDINFIT